MRGPRKDDALVPVYEDGRLLKTYTLDEVRAQAARGIALTSPSGLPACRGGLDCPTFPVMQV